MCSSDLTDGNGTADGYEDADGDGLINLLDPLPLDFNYQDADLNNSQAVDAADVLIVTQIALGLRIPTLADLQHGDIAPLGAPDGVINAADLLQVIKMSLQ